MQPVGDWARAQDMSDLLAKRHRGPLVGPDFLIHLLDTARINDVSLALHRGIDTFKN